VLNTTCDSDEQVYRMLLPLKSAGITVVFQQHTTIVHQTQTHGPPKMD